MQSKRDKLKLAILLGLTVSCTVGINTPSVFAETITVTGNVTSTVPSTSTYTGTDPLIINQIDGTISTTTTDAVNVDNEGTSSLTVSLAGNATSSLNNCIVIKNGTSATDLTLTQSAGSTVSAPNDNCISVNNTGSGSTSVSLDGTVTNGYRDGVWVSAAGTDTTINLGSSSIINGQRSGVDVSTTGKSLTITQAAGSTVTGSVNYGIQAVNNGTGATNISIAGNVTGGNNDGVFFQNTSNDNGDLTITQAAGSTITGSNENGGCGIRANNIGNGAVYISVAGNVTGPTWGIKALTDGGDINVNVSGNVTATTTNGNSDAETGIGIRLDSYNPDSSANEIVTQEAGSTITGEIAGIDCAYQQGSGSITITTSGTVNGGTWGGIGAYNNSNADAVTVTQLAGKITGSTGVNLYDGGNGNITVTQSAGAVIIGDDGSGGGLGIGVYNCGTNTDSIITTAGSVTGGSNGGGISITNAGTVTGNLTVTQTGGTITGGYGVGAEDDNTNKIITINQTGGTITGTTGAGISAKGTTINVSTVAASGATDGLSASNVGSSLTVNQSGSISGGTNGAEADNTSTTGGTTAVSIGGTVSGGTGAGVITEENTGTSVTTDIKNGAVVSGATNAVQDTNGNAAVTLENGSTISGAVRLGDGNDTLNVIGTANIGGTSAILDGGNTTDSSVTDTLAANTATNKLNFNDTTQTLTGANILNWQTVTLDNSSITLNDGILNTGGRLSTGSAIDSDGTTQAGLSLTDASALYSPVTLAVSGDVNIDASSELKHAVGGSINGDVTNAGTIYWGNLNHTLNISGNYTGISGSKLSLETYLAGDNSATDKMAVAGNTSGSSAVTIRKASGSPGAKTNIGIDVIQVGGSSNGTFTLANAVQAGAYQYTLQKGGNGGSASDWYLVSNTRPGANDSAIGQAVNAEEGFITTSTFHERRGEDTITDNNGHQEWARTYYYNLSADGEKQVSYSGAKLYGIQVGQDLWSHTDTEGTSKRLAVTLDYTHTTADFDDYTRPSIGLKSYIGSLSGEDTGIGCTYSRVTPSGTYLDLVGRISILRNKFDITDTGSAYQNGLRGMGSIEVGKPYNMKGGWKIEPQAQLIYMHTRYDSFTDSVSDISGYSANVLRGRLGVRIFQPKANGEYRRFQVYGIADVLHDFIGASDVTVGGTKISNDFRHTSFDIGLGGEYKINRDVSFYCRGLYQHSFSDGINNKSHGYFLSAGLKWSFGGKKKAAPIPEPVTVAEPVPVPVAVPKPAPVKERYFDSVHFAFDVDTPLSEEEAKIEHFAEVAKANPDKTYAIVGNTDSIGTDEYNDDLSRRRAENVKNEAEEDGVPAAQMQDSYLGKAHPIDTNDTEEGRANNRRVEIYEHSIN